MPTLHSYKPPLLDYFELLVGGDAPGGDNGLPILHALQPLVELKGAQIDNHAAAEQYIANQNLQLVLQLLEMHAPTALFPTKHMQQPLGTDQMFLRRTGLLLNQLRLQLRLLQSQLHVFGLLRDLQKHLLLLVVVIFDIAQLMRCAL